jgi:hypothetical protein
MIDHRGGRPGGPDGTGLAAPEGVAGTVVLLQMVFAFSVASGELLLELALDVQDGLDRRQLATDWALSITGP